MSSAPTTAAPQYPQIVVLNVKRAGSDGAAPPGSRDAARARHPARIAPRGPAAGQITYIVCVETASSSGASSRTTAGRTGIDARQGVTAS